MDTIVWLIVVAVMLVIEILTMGLTTIWFSVGAAAAAIAAGMGGSFWLQIILFSTVSVAVMLLVRPFAKKVVNKGHVRTNIDEVLGEQALVVSQIDNQRETGTVRLKGVEWTARSADDSVIPEDAAVVVEEVSGVKLIVKKMQQTD